MYIFSIIWWSLLINTCFSQLKSCYLAVEEELSGDFPCNPDANVSSCCAPGNVCSSNLFCVSASNHQNYVGTCTDRTWSSPLCPFNLTSGVFDPWYDKFSYAFNTTQCWDGTLCPFNNNEICCDARQGVKEIHHNYTSNAIVPANVLELPSFYSAAGYAFPTSSSTSATSDLVQLTTSSAAANHNLPVSTPRKSTAPDVLELTTLYTASTGYTFPTSISSVSGHSYPNLTTTFTASAVTSAVSTKKHLNRSLGTGIGITLSVAACCVCAILFHLYIHRRLHRQQQNGMPKTSSVSPVLQKPVHGIVTEMEGTPMEELNEVHELDNGSL